MFNGKIRSSFARILSYFKPYWKHSLYIFIVVIITSALGILPPLLTKGIIDTALPQSNFRMLVIYVSFSFMIILILNLFNVLQSYLSTLVAKNIVRDIRLEMYNHIQKMPLKFFSETKLGEITSRLNNDIGGIENIFSNTFVQLIQGIFIFAITAVTLFVTNWKLALISMLTLPLFILPTKTVGKARWQIAIETQTKLAELTTLITDTLSISGNLLIKLFTKETDKSEEYKKVNNEATQLGIRETVVGRWFIMAIQTFVSISPLLIYLFGGFFLIKYHTITIGGIVMFVSLVSRLYIPVNTFASIHADLVRSFAFFDRIFEYLDLKNNIVEKDSAIDYRINGKIEFEKVTFSYHENSPVLHDINFKIEPGQMAALVGPSGAGKTTISYLIPRLYDVTSGEVLIDGINIKDMSINSLRKQIGMVTQDTFLFNVSIRENLLLGRADASEKEIVDACQKANIHDFIASLPDGYDTVVGNCGLKLSGGQKQRISIARTLLKDPKIVIFDEATSSLDSNSEQLIQQAVKPLLKSRTSLVIAHRLSTIVSADIIFVINHGIIVGCGKHLDLLKKSNLYKELYERQFNIAINN